MGIALFIDGYAVVLCRSMVVSVKQFPQFSGNPGLGEVFRQSGEQAAQAAMGLVAVQTEEFACAADAQAILVAHFQQ